MTSSDKQMFRCPLVSSSVPTPLDSDDEDRPALQVPELPLLEDIDQLPANDMDADLYANGSTMTEPTSDPINLRYRVRPHGSGRARSRSRRRRPNFLAPLSFALDHRGLLAPARPGHRDRRGGYVPHYARFMLDSTTMPLPIQIRPRLPQQDSSDMTYAAMVEHCVATIRSIRGSFPRRWYIGITCDPRHRLENCVYGHRRNFPTMFLLITARSSDVTRPIERDLIIMHRGDVLLLNQTPDAAGSLAGSPHFLYVCFADRDSQGAVLRRPR